MAKNKKSFLLYCDFVNVFDQLSDKEAGVLIKHLFHYVNDMKPELENRLLKMAFEPIRQQLKRDLVKYESIREKNSKNAKIRWDKDAKLCDRIKRNAKSTKNADTGIDTVTDTVNENVTKRERGAFAPPALQDVIFEMSKKLDEFSAMGQGQQFINHYTSNGWMVGKNKMKDWPAAARGWISRMGNYQPKKLNGSRNIHERLQKEGHEKV